MMFISNVFEKKNQNDVSYAFPYIMPIVMARKKNQGLWFFLLINPFFNSFSTKDI